MGKKSSSSLPIKKALGKRALSDKMILQRKEGIKVGYALLGAFPKAPLSTLARLATNASEGSLHRMVKAALRKAKKVGIPDKVSLMMKKIDEIVPARVAALAEVKALMKEKQDHERQQEEQLSAVTSALAVTHGLQSKRRRRRRRHPSTVNGLWWRPMETHVRSHKRHMRWTSNSVDRTPINFCRTRTRLWLWRL